MESKDSELAVRLIDSSEGDLPGWRPVRPSKAAKVWIHSPCAYFAILQLFLVAVYTTLLFLLRCPLPNCSGTTYMDGFTPAQSALSLAPQLFAKNGHFHSPFSRPPGPATDAAWAGLLQGGNMRVSQSELSHYPNATSVRVLQAPADTSEPQYLAKMGFYHELHCLHKMKRWLYPTTYYVDASSAFLAEEKEHIEHCIEWIRTAAVCRGDTTLTLFEWVDGQLETKYPIPHQCVDEETLLGWSREEGRMVNIDVEGMIEGPSQEL